LALCHLCVITRGGYHEGSWIHLKELDDENVSLITKYIWSLFMAVSQMLSIGYGQFPPGTIGEVCYTMAFTCIGAIFWSSIIGMLVNITNAGEARNAHYKEKLGELREYMHYKKLPHKLREDILDYYDMRYSEKEFVEGNILFELNPILRTQVVDYNCYNLVARLGLFKYTSSSFIHAVIYKLCYEVFNNDDVIIKEGQQCRGMYFISRGKVSIQSKHFKLSQYLGKGKYFGETCLLNPFGKRPCSVSAIEATSIYVLATEDFESIIEEFPDDMKVILFNAKVLYDLEQ
jgi:hypothetical protein